MLELKKENNFMIREKTISSDLRFFDQCDVRVLCKEGGLQRTYEGTLYFVGKEEGIMVGCDEILCECIVSIDVL